MSKARRPSDSEIAEQLKAIKESIDELSEKDSKKSLPSFPPSELQKKVERAAPAIGVEGNRAWTYGKDTFRSFTGGTFGTNAEAVARKVLRGEDYESAKNKIEEYKEDLEKRRPVLYNAGMLTSAAASTAAGIWVYTKLARRVAEQAAATAAPATGRAVAVAANTSVAAVSRSRAAAQTAASVAKAAPKNPLGLAIAAAAGIGAFVTRSSPQTISVFYRTGPLAGRTIQRRLPAPR